jgi:hypothetical protein
MRWGAPRSRSSTLAGSLPKESVPSRAASWSCTVVEPGASSSPEFGSSGSSAAVWGRVHTASGSTCSARRATTSAPVSMGPRRGHGSAQDQVGQILADGRLVVHGDVGQAFLYAAKGGEVYVLATRPAGHWSTPSGDLGSSSTAPAWTTSPNRSWPRIHSPEAVSLSSTGSPSTAPDACPTWKRRIPAATSLLDDVRRHRLAPPRPRLRGPRPCGCISLRLGPAASRLRPAHRQRSAGGRSSSRRPLDEAPPSGASARNCRQA